jgi:hypothetical protein
MPLKVIKSTTKGKTVYKVEEPTGEVLGTHPSREAAQKQIQAIQIAKAKRNKG